MLLLENMALSHECIKKIRRGNTAVEKNNDFLLKSVKIKQLFLKNVSKKNNYFRKCVKKKYK